MKKAIAVICAAASLTFAQKIQFEPNAAQDRRIDEILHALASRCETPPVSGILQQPMNYGDLREFLREVENCQNLTATDKEQLAILQNRFSGNTRLAQIGDSAGAYRIVLNLDLTGRAKFYGDFDASGTINPKLTANMGVFSFYSDLHVSTQYRSDTAWDAGNYSPFRGETYNAIGDAPSHLRAMDGFRAGTSAQSKRARIDVAVDNLTSGPAVYNRLMLNITDKPLFYTRFSLDFGRLQYYQVFGMLKELRRHNKYLYYHRVEIPFFENALTVGLNASVISGSTGDSATMYEPHGQIFPSNGLNVRRKIEPIYMIPFVPYFFAEHFVGDLDNKQIGLDFELRLPQAFRWYLEFFIDDGSAPHTLFNDEWANKWALTVGGQWFGVVGGKNLLLGVEYCRVEPWVYTHFRGAATNHGHYGRSIGAELGPNSAQIRGTSQYNISQRHAFRLEAVHSRFNREVRGGSLGDVFILQHTADFYGISADSEKKEFLGDGFTSAYSVTLSHIFGQFGRFEAQTSVFYDKEKGAGLGIEGGFRF